MKLFPPDVDLKATAQTEWALANPQFFCREFKKELKSRFDQEVEADLYRATMVKLAGAIRDLANGFNHGSDAQAVEAAKIGMIIAEQLRFGKKAVRILATMMERTDRVYAMLTLDDVAERVCFRYFYDLGSDGIETLLYAWTVYSAYESKNYPLNFETKLRNLVYRLIYYYYAEFCTIKPQPLLSGDDLISRFGLKEGKDIGIVLSRLGEAEAQGQLSSREEALDFVKEFIDRYGDSLT